MKCGAIRSIIGVKIPFDSNIIFYGNAMVEAACPLRSFRRFQYGKSKKNGVFLSELRL